MKNVLWIDEGAPNLGPLAAPILMTRYYALTVVNNVADALMMISKQEYHIIVFEPYCLMPGSNCSRQWAEFYHKNFKGKDIATELLRVLLSPAEATLEFEVPEWVEGKRFGIFSTGLLEEYAKLMDQCGIRKFLQKPAELSSYALLEFIMDIDPDPVPEQVSNEIAQRQRIRGGKHD